MFLVPETETFVDEVAQLSPSKSTQKSFQVDPPSSVLTCSSQVASCQQILRGGIQLLRTKWISWLGVYRKETASKFVDNNSLMLFLVTSPFVIFSSCDLCTFFWQDSFGQGSFVSSSFNLSWNQWKPKSSDLLRDEVTLAPILELPIVKWNAGMSAAQKWRARKSSLFDKNSFFSKDKENQIVKGSLKLILDKLSIVKWPPLNFFGHIRVDSDSVLHPSLFSNQDRLGLSQDGS